MWLSHSRKLLSSLREWESHVKVKLFLARTRDSATLRTRSQCSTVEFEIQVRPRTKTAFNSVVRTASERFCLILFLIFNLR